MSICLKYDWNKDFALISKRLAGKDLGKVAESIKLSASSSFVGSFVRSLSIYLQYCVDYLEREWKRERRERWSNVKRVQVTTTYIESGKGNGEIHTQFDKLKKYYLSRYKGHCFFLYLESGVVTDWDYAERWTKLPLDLVLLYARLIELLLTLFFLSITIHSTDDSFYSMYSLIHSLRCSIQRSKNLIPESF